MFNVYGSHSGFNIDDIKWRTNILKNEATNYYEVDLRNTRTKSNIIYKLGEVFRGEASVPMEDMGGTIDALSDVAFDYFYDSWMRGDTIVIRGWKNAIDIDLGYSQMIFDVLDTRYLESIEYRIESTLEDDDDFSLTLSDVLAGLKKRTKIYFFMN